MAILDKYYKQVQTEQTPTLENLLSQYVDLMDEFEKLMGDDQSQMPIQQPDEMPMNLVNFLKDPMPVKLPDGRKVFR